MLRKERKWNHKMLNSNLKSRKITEDKKKGNKIKNSNKYDRYESNYINTHFKFQ